MEGENTLEQPSGLISRFIDLLNPNTVVIGLVAGFTLYWVGSIIYYAYFHPLSKYPGPRLWAITRLPYAFYLQRGRLPQTVKALHDKYGTIIRIAPDELSFIEGSAWKDIYQPRAGHGPFDKWSMYLNPAVNGAYSILTSPTLQGHARIKRQLNHGFSDKALQAQEGMFQGHADLFISRIHDVIESGKKNLDMHQWYAWVTSDIMGDLVFGESFGCLEDSKDHRWISILIQQFTSVVTITSFRFFALPRKLLQMYMPDRILERPREIHEYAVEKVNKRISRDTERPDFMYYMQRENKDNTQMSREEIDTTLSALVVAGGETTATFLSGITFCLVQHPEVLHKLENEVRTAFKSEDEINAVSTNKLVYFNACVKEGLRLTPAVPFGHPRTVPPGGDEVCGKRLPGGTKVTIMAYAMYRSEHNFKNPKTFDPERWLNWNGYDDQSAYEPFSLGPRNCIGKNLALVELKIILARAIFNFNFSLPEGKSDMGWEWGDQNIYMLWKCEPMVVQVTNARKGVA
ncbi:putative cytochrome p450 protein [Eutypa lata UCREL1]|uniref:Putative cytochrome p450 protein n=1 Tax=Eutypa lata (strain UCR-EL1) TaxID=1287681 RepID=M7TPW4_EUTLA|nr:putative cytochrome p450 protein [Eutypa lata UCREL1]